MLMMMNCLSVELVGQRMTMTKLMMTTTMGARKEMTMTKLISTTMSMIMGGRMKMNLKLSLAVTPSQAPTRPSAVVTWREREALILKNTLIDVINM